MKSLDQAIAETVDPFNPKRSIKPRKNPSEGSYKPLIVVDGDSIFVERTGELVSRKELATVIQTEPASLIICHNAGILVRELHETLDSHPLWQFRVTPVEREITQRNGRTLVSTDSVVAFFGFQRPNGHAQSKYHYPLDPTVLCRKTANNLYPEEPTTLAALFRFGKEIREFLQEQGIHPKATSGGLAGQLLKDSRFYPDARRKVPRSTNEKAREHLPGNYYRLYGGQSTAHAIYFDQKGSHHKVASEINLPHADGLYARGRFHENGTNDIWCRNGTPRFHRETRERFGLLKVWLDVPHGASYKFCPPYMEKPGRKVAFIYTNEISLIESLGGYIEGIIAAWTSNIRDTGIAAYANWAQDEIAHTDSRTKGWKKAVLLSAYGVLASRPRKIKVGYAKAKSGTKSDVYVGGLPISIYLKETTKEGGDTLTNVIQRGMIEAETRKRSLEFARTLKEQHGAKVILIYADGVIASDIDQIPMLPPEWKIESELTNLFVLNPVTFTSREMTKMPGIPFENEREILRRIERAKQQNFANEEKPRKLRKDRIPGPADYAKIPGSEFWVSVSRR